MKKTLRTGFYAFAILLLLADMVMQVLAANAGDKDWLLLAARRWLEGQTLYADIFEVNPPLILWLYAIPERLALLSGISDILLLGLMALFAAACSVALGMALIRHHPAFADNPRRRGEFALLLAYVLVFFSTQVHFFDRDDAFFIFIFPYLLRFMPSLAHAPLPLRLRIAVALFAAIGFCIKPYTIIVFVLLQLIAILRERSFAPLVRLENLIIYGVGAAYFASIALFAPEYLRTVLPMAAATYSGFSRRINGFLYLAIAFISAGLSFVDFRPRFATPYRRDVYYFIGACGAFLVYALAGNGWGYTYNPLLCLLLFTSGWLWWEYGWIRHTAEAQGMREKTAVSGRRGCAANLVLNIGYITLCIAVFFTQASCEKVTECRENEGFARYIREHHVPSFASFSMDMRRWTTLTRETGARWDNRSNHLWMLPELVKAGPEEAAKDEWIRAYVGRAYAQDLNRLRPAVVFVDTSDGIFAYPHPVDMVAFFRVPELAQAWSHYHYLETLDQCPAPPEKPAAAPPSPAIDCRYAIYGRND